MIGAIDSTVPQVAADLLLVLLVAVNAYAGWRTGALRRLLAMVGVYAAFAAAFYAGNSFASMVRKGDVVANGWAFVGVACAVVVVFEMLGHLFADRIERVAALAFDRVVGLLVGAAVGFFQVLALFMVALAVGTASPAPSSASTPPRDAAARAVRGATLAGAALRAEPVVRAAVAPVLDADLSTHLADASPGTALHP